MAYLSHGIHGHPPEQSSLTVGCRVVWTQLGICKGLNKPLQALTFWVNCPLYRWGSTSFLVVFQSLGHWMMKPLSLQFSLRQVKNAGSSRDKYDRTCGHGKVPTWRENIVLQCPTAMGMTTLSSWKYCPNSWFLWRQIWIKSIILIDGQLPQIFWAFQ